MNAPDRYADCIGRLVELVPGDDELLMLVRYGMKFANQHRGKRPEFLRQFLTSIVARMPEPVRFADLLKELGLHAARRELYGEQASPIEKVDRRECTLTYRHPIKGAKKIGFRSLANTLVKINSSLTAK